MIHTFVEFLGEIMLCTKTLMWRTERAT